MHIQNRFRRLFISLAVICLAASAVALDLPTKKIKGKEYYYYEVKKGETVYSLSVRFGVTRDELVKYNPEAADGLKAGSILFFPVDEFANNNKSFIFYKVHRGETLFSISRKYDVHVRELESLNPDAANGLKTGMVIKIPKRNSQASASSTVIAAEPTQTKPQPEQNVENKAEKQSPVIGKNDLTYTVRQGDTFYSVARAAGISVETLTELNPFVSQNEMSVGTVLRLKDTAPVTFDEGNREMRPVDIPRTEVATVPVQRTDFDKPVSEIVEASADQNSEDEAIDIDLSKQQTIALILPFMLNENKPSKQANLYTDFYKGLLVAADSLRNTEGAPVKILVFDTRNDIERIRTQILSRPDVKAASIIIAPEDGDQLQLITNAARQNGTYVFNIFNVKDESHLKNPYVIQGNIDQTTMYVKAASALHKQFPEHTPVILRSTNGKDDKVNFTEMLKNLYINKTDIKPIEISYTGTLNPTDLSALSADGRYIIIPSSGALAEFNKISAALQSAKNERIDPDSFIVFGYPEWTSFRGDTNNAIHNLDAIVYSRFFYDYTSPRRARVDETYTKWYGNAPAEVLPNQAELGFDVGCYLINALRKNGGYFTEWLPDAPTYEGVQSSFSFKENKYSDRGFVNNALYIIRFRPDKTYEVKVY